jgi:DNA-binding MarR family transcriptional regulator
LPLRVYPQLLFSSIAPPRAQTNRDDRLAPWDAWNVAACSACKPRAIGHFSAGQINVTTPISELCDDRFSGKPKAVDIRSCDNMLSCMKANHDPIQELVLGIFHLDDLLKACANEITRPAGQTGARWQVMNAIISTPRTVAEIARFKKVARQGVQRIVNELVAEGFAATQRNPEHSRYPLIDLTEKGRSALRSIEHQRSQWQGEVRKHLGEEIKPEVLDFLKRFTVAISKTMATGGK